MMNLNFLNEKLLQLRLEKKLWLQTGDTAMVTAPSNIALIKYWGKDPVGQQIPQNSSLSLTLRHFFSSTTLTVKRGFFSLEPQTESVFNHTFFLDHKQNLEPKLHSFIKNILSPFASDCVLHINSMNNFPTACGIASSASGYAALVLALADLLRLKTLFTKAEQEAWIHHWARMGSGSASRSVDLQPLLSHSTDHAPPQCIEWDYNAHTHSHTWRTVDIHPSLHHLEHGIMILNDQPKAISSSQGHLHAHNLPLQHLRVASTPARLLAVKQALAQGCFASLQLHTETDAFMMHAVMHSSTPALNYLNNTVAQVLALLIQERDAAQAVVLWTLDAGPNIHLLFLPQAKPFIQQFLLKAQHTLGTQIPFFTHGTS